MLKILVIPFLFGAFLNQALAAVTFDCTDNFLKHDPTKVEMTFNGKILSVRESEGQPAGQADISCIMSAKQAEQKYFVYDCEGQLHSNRIFRVLVRDTLFERNRGEAIFLTTYGNEIGAIARTKCTR